MIQLPEAFLQRMKKDLGEEYEPFIESYNRERSFGLRCNPLKCSLEAFVDKMPFELKDIPWAKEGFFYKNEQHPGKHVLHEAGAYYIQEPSAMAVVEALDPMPGEYILDLCAAPGGKSTQIAGRLQGKGLLVANEIIPSRAKILSQNIERMGVRNCVVTNESADRLMPYFTAFFDKIVVDAPCSGEGMFRKDEIAIREWSEENVEICANRQRLLLEQAATMLKPGGTLVYSTCTFSKQEDEETIAYFSGKHPDWRVVKTSNASFFEEGQVPNTVRIWPHKVEGEGHFIARLEKPGEWIPSKIRDQKASKAELQAKSSIEPFLTKDMGIRMELGAMRLQLFGEHIYAIPSAIEGLKGLKVERAGLHIADQKKGRLEPAHALAMSMRIPECERAVELDLESANGYLRGESIRLESTLTNGWCVVFYNEVSIGYGKIVNGLLKNHYPKGLRMN